MTGATLAKIALEVTAPMLWQVRDPLPVQSTLLFRL